MLPQKYITISSVLNQPTREELAATQPKGGPVKPPNLNPYIKYITQEYDQYRILKLKKSALSVTSDEIPKLFESLELEKSRDFNSLLRLMDIKVDDLRVLSANAPNILEKLKQYQSNVENKLIHVISEKSEELYTISKSMSDLQTTFKVIDDELLSHKLTLEKIKKSCDSAFKVIQTKENVELLKKFKSMIKDIKECEELLELTTQLLESKDYFAAHDIIHQLELKLPRFPATQHMWKHLEMLEKNYNDGICKEGLAQIFGIRPNFPNLVSNFEYPSILSPNYSLPTLNKFWNTFESSGMIDNILEEYKIKVLKAFEDGDWTLLGINLSSDSATSAKDLIKRTSSAVIVLFSQYMLFKSKDQTLFVISDVIKNLTQKLLIPVEGQQKSIFEVVEFETLMDIYDGCKKLISLLQYLQTNDFSLTSGKWISAEKPNSITILNIFQAWFITSLRQRLLIFHNKNSSDITSLIQNEQWGSVDVPGEFMMLLKKIENENLISDESDQSPKEKLVILGKSYPIVGVVLYLIKFLYSYLSFAKSCNDITWDSFFKVMEFLRNFNSLVCQSVLGGGAAKTAGLKSITAKHLCLSWQSVEVIVALSPFIIGFFTNKIPEDKISFMNEEVQKLANVVKDHQKEIELKLVHIIKERTLYYLGAFKVMLIYLEN
eukprot:NODE_313_length_10011_cov_0.634584.p1 type:complete len:662 gc:universal NODE_313_length_10011_cov_0.634584:6308-4323(-)